VVLLDLQTGRELGVAVVPYRHGVISTVLPGTDKQLPPDWALQHPADWIDVIRQGIPEVLRQTKVSADDVVGLGIDFTSCTVLPVLSDNTPMCLNERWATRPHAWPKLWKHHAAQYIADRINEVARRREEAFLLRYGGQISSEWYFPKLLQVFEEDPDVYAACDAFVEAADWIIWFLTGERTRNACTAGYKAMWDPDRGFPSVDFFTDVNAAFVRPFEKLGHDFKPLGSVAGTLRADLAEEIGLHPGVRVAVGNVDAHVSVPGVGVHEPGSLVMVIGTSICHLTVSEREVHVPGMTGVVRDGVLPGLWGYEAGQAAVGDMFAWYVRQAVPASVEAQAQAAGVSVYEWLEAQAARVPAGARGIVALDWWNGNRSVLGDASLSGVIVGLTLASTPDVVYRALLESVAFGTKRIMDNFDAAGVSLTDIVACGGISRKSPLLMQIYADACGVPVIVRDSTEVPARGAALFGAVAAGYFSDIREASEALRPKDLRVYEPDREQMKRYREVYEIYRDLYEWFGTERRDLMHRLKRFVH
jgi:L-ribulokinase